MKRLLLTDERPPYVEIMTRLGLAPDPWQREVLDSDHPQLLLNCSRQAGKSTVVAMLALVEAMFRPMTRVILVSRSHRQSRELLKTIVFYYDLLGGKLTKRVSAKELELSNMSRIVSVPCREDTIRGYAAVDLLIIDEAARVPDDLYRAVRPMLAVSKGRLICLSTPHGKRGFFWDAWARGGDDWLRIEIPASKVPRITAAFLAQEQRALGDSWFRQEYCCSFEALEGLVYPDFARCVVEALPSHVPDWKKSKPERLSFPDLNWVGGLDFGFRNPFAAVWGVVDRDDILWLIGEYYVRQKAVCDHLPNLPKHVMWYADPAGASDIATMRRHDFKVRSANNSLRPGIAAVSARLNAGTLRVLKGRCPNLLAEAGLYTYGETSKDRQGEKPLDDHNHALDALRYLIHKIDAHHRVRPADEPIVAEPSAAPPPKRDRYASGWPDPEDESLWTPIGGWGR